MRARMTGIAVVTALFLAFGLARGVEPWRLLGAVATLALIIGGVWLAGYRGGVR